MENINFIKMAKPKTKSRVQTIRYAWPPDHGIVSMKGQLGQVMSNTIIDPFTIKEPNYLNNITKRQNINKNISKLNS